MGDRIGLILPRGGARCAYQVGALRAIAEVVQSAANPFQVIVGTSSGAVAAAVIAAGANDWPRPVRALEDVWANFRLGQVVHAERAYMLRSGARLLGSLLSAGRIRAPGSLLDTAPLHELLRQRIDFGGVTASVKSGALHALGICATSYHTRESVTFFDGEPSIPDWQRSGRRGLRTELLLDHVMASTALPALFPPVAIDGHYFGDGAMLQMAPLSAAIRLGATRLLVIGVRREVDVSARLREVGAGPPTPAGLLGLMLDSLFFNQIFRDLELARRFNRFADTDPTLRKLGILRLEPSQNIGAIAAACRDRLPGTVKALLGVLGGRGAAGDTLAGYLLFESEFTRQLIHLGYDDVMSQRATIADFLRGSDDK